MSETLAVALIGSKFMGRTHSNGFSQVSRFFDLERVPVLHTVAARNIEELKAFAARWGWRHWTTDWRELCADPHIDLIDIGTPNHLHREQAIAALEAGKHVACEKPLAGTLEDARAMRAAAAKAGNCRTFVWFNYRRVPAIALAHQMIREGRLGRIYHIRCCYLQDWGGPQTPMLWRFQGDLAGSGALGDLAAHSIDLARFLTGEEVTEVSGAVMETFIRERKILEEAQEAGSRPVHPPRMARSTVDDAAAFIARFEGGALATFEATRLATGEKNANRIEIHAEGGALRFDFDRLSELQWFDRRLPEREQGWSTIHVSDGEAGHPYGEAWWPAGHAIGYEHTFVNQAADICRLIAGAAPLVPLPDFEDAYQTQRVMEAVQQSAAHRCAIPLSEIL